MLRRLFRTFSPRLVFFDFHQVSSVSALADAIDHVTVLTMAADGTVLRDQTVTIRDGRIASIEASAERSVNFGNNCSKALISSRSRAASSGAAADIANPRGEALSTCARAIDTGGSTAVFDPSINIDIKPVPMTDTVPFQHISNLMTDHRFI
jgi:hypothetical protein